MRAAHSFTSDCLDQFKSLVNSLALAIAPVLAIVLAQSAALSPAQAEPPPDLRAKSSTVIWFQSASIIREAALAIDEGKFAAGLALAREALVLDLVPKDRAAVHNNICAAYLGLQLYEEALSHCKTSLGLEARDWRTLNNLGNVHLALGDFDTALDFYDRALAIQPDMDVLIYNADLARKRAAESQPVTPPAEIRS